MLSLLQQEGIPLSVQQVIVQRCCEALPVWDSCPGSPGREAGQGRPGDGVFGVASMTALLHQHAQEHMPTLGLTEPQSDPSSESSEASPQDVSATPAVVPTSPQSPPAPSPSSSSSFLLTPSALSFLKSRSSLLATLACLSASRGGTARSSGWSGLPSYFRGGRKEVVLDEEQISKEGDGLLKDFPILRAHLQAMAQPVLGTLVGDSEEGGGGLGTALCGRPVVGLLLSGPQGGSAQAAAAEAFQQALTSRDLGRALSLLELYGQGCSQERALRDKLLACAALEGERVVNMA